MPANPSTASLSRKIRRLESKVQMLEAECELYQMMAHDLASEAVINAITRKWPAIAKSWEAA